MTPQSSTPAFHPLTAAQVRPEAGGSVAIRLDVPEPLLGLFAFQPGQYLTLRAQLNGQALRRNYSICSTPKNLQERQQLEIGVRAVAGGVFSNWLVNTLRPGDVLQVMPPEGRFVAKKHRALHRVGFAAGSGITPLLSLMQHSLESGPETKFSLIYGNRNMASVMFNEALQDLKDRYPDRVTLLHILSRQAQGADLLEGHIDGDKVRRLLATLLPVGSLDEVFICGPSGMIDATEQALLQAGVRPDRIQSERFGTTDAPPTGSASEAAQPPSTHSSTKSASRPSAAAAAHSSSAPQVAAVLAPVALTLLIDGQSHSLRMDADQHVLDVALAAGLEPPHACRGGVCCTCRAKVLQGSAVMDKNFTLENWETDQGFVLTCQARPTSERLVLSYDER